MKKIIFLLTCLLAVFAYQNADAQAIKIYKGGNVVQTFTVAEFDSIVSIGYHETEEEFVDLGLSVKWASRNLGAKSPEDYGDYYAWGETSSKESYTKQNSLTYGKNMSDIGGNPKYDAATANCGKGVRLPTNSEFDELRDNTTTTWTERNGVKGYLVISKINGNSIFLPASGVWHNTSLNDLGECGYYWSSTSKEDSSQSLGLYFHRLFFYGMTFDRFSGQSVRPVRN